MNEHVIIETQGVTETTFELFGDNLGRFRQHLIDQNHAESTVEQYMGCIGILAETMRAERIALENLDEAQAAELVVKTGWTGKRRTYAAFMARRFVRFLIEQGIGKPSLPSTAREIARAELRREYEVYLRRQRGLSERTIFHS
jgi:integrase/recombinase XerD